MVDVDAQEDQLNEEAASFGDNLTEPMSFVENPVLVSIIDQFITTSQMKLSSFLRKKLLIKCEAINSCHFHEVTHDYTKLHMLNFYITPHEKYALIAFDFTFLHLVINLLYGGGVNEEETVMTSLGKSGVKIAEKMASLFLEVLQEYMIEELKLTLKFSSISPQLSPVFKQSKTKKCYNISLKILIDSVVTHMNLIIPEMVFSPLEREPEHDTMAGKDKLNTQEMIASPLIFDDKMKEELIDSAVMVTFNLPPLTLKLKEVIHLKSGDIIPIDDPKNVMVVVNNKAIFTATAGQAEQRRVVKILNKV
ncbi:MAG: FliM/FliN family flagellar motor switch protein [Legionella sp.]|nr:FliM/FliN family flagellar motor switch protein [Legionella sp.]